MLKPTIEAFRQTGYSHGFVQAGGTLVTSATSMTQDISHLFDGPSPPPHPSRHADSYEIVI
jgi:hypothetical protein